MHRFGAPFYGKQFIGNKNTNEVHNLDNERNDCQINSINPSHVVTFTPDTYDQAKHQGFDNCAYCIGKSKY